MRNVTTEEFLQFHLEQREGKQIQWSWISVSGGREVKPNSKGCLDLTYSSNFAILSRKLECMKATEISDISKFADNLQGLWKAV